MLIALAGVAAFMGMMQSVDASAPGGASARIEATSVSWVGNLRVGGKAEADLDVLEGPDGPLYRAGKVATDTKLPVGYPAPTPPGAIEIKQYESVRRAEFSSSGGMGWGGGKGFWPLFRHIQRKEIAMTAPVETEYADTNNDRKLDRWTMAFLYHSTSDGPTGADGSVKVVDTAPITVVSLGLRGGSAIKSPEKAAKPLEEWLAANATEWKRQGDLRVLGYNGPNVRAANRWWEVQIPIERVTAPATPASESVYSEHKE